MNKYALTFLIFIVILIFGFANAIIKIVKKDLAIIKINETIFEVEVADTILGRAKGLSGRKTLEENKGMLFLFKEPSKQSFWMAGMNFPLDIIWISGNEIVDISKNIQPPSVSWRSGELPAIVSPSMEVDKVLEIPAGSADKFDIKAGDKLEYD